MALIPEREVSNEALGKFLTSQGLSHSLDDAGDIYVSDDVLGFPFWISIDRCNKVLVYMTYMEYASAELAEAALEEAQRTLLGPITPRFLVHDSCLHGLFFVSYSNGVVGAHIYEAACRFTEYFLRTPWATSNLRDGRLMH